MSEEAAGYAVLADRLGRVRQVRNGVTALAAVDAACYYMGNGVDPDEAYAVAQAGSGPEQCACGDWNNGSGAVLEGAVAELATLRSDLAALADRVQALELERCAERGEL